MKVDEAEGSRGWQYCVQGRLGIRSTPPLLVFNQLPDEVSRVANVWVTVIAPFLSLVDFVVESIGY